jgi:hypothetical protein
MEGAVDAEHQKMHQPGNNTGISHNNIPMTRHMTPPYINRLEM